MRDKQAFEKVVRESTLAQRLHRKAGAIIAYVDGDRTEIVALGSGVQRDTPVQVGSVTKVFTGLLLAQAVLRDELALTSRIDEVLFGERWLQPPAISAVALATHTSGLPRLSLLWRRFCPDPYRTCSRVDLLAYLQRKHPRQPDAPKYIYSNVGYAILGLMLEDACSQTYAQLLQDRLLTPLGLTSTSLALPDMPDLVQRGYRSHITPIWHGPRPAVWHFKAYAPCGAMVSTLDDLVQTLRAFFRPKGDIAEALQLSMQPRAAIPSGSIGLAWHSPPGVNWVWHNGATFGHASYLAVDKQRQAGVAIVANQALAMPVTQLGHQLIQQQVMHSS